MSYEQRNKVYSSLQYGITEWLVDIQNTGILTSEKLKKKFCSLKLPRPPDKFLIFDTRPQDFIVVSDDLTTANMDPCRSSAKFVSYVLLHSCCKIHLRKTAILLIHNMWCQANDKPATDSSKQCRLASDEIKMTDSLSRKE